jgi:hypothetical protein
MIKQYLGLFVTVSVLSLSSTASFSQVMDDSWEIDARVNIKYTGEENSDFGDSYLDSLVEEFQLFVQKDFSPDSSVYFHGRAFNLDGDVGFDDDEGESISGETAFLELRELFYRQENLFGYNPAYFQVGRQRIREPRAIWWNNDADLIKAGWDSTTYSGFLAAGEDLNSYRIGESRDFENNDEDRFRVLGEASWQYAYGHFFELRGLYENDHSGVVAVGESFGDERDSEDQSLFWYGARVAGYEYEPMQGLDNIKYRVDLIGLTGEETISSGGAVVTSVNERDVNAWAFDGGVALTPSFSHGAVFDLGYAIGTGEDDTTGTSNEFRQTDLDGSSSRLGLERDQQRHYGEVLRPELSNIHILRAAVDYPLSDHSSSTLAFYNYRLDEEDTSLRSSGVSADLNGTDKSLGQAVDLAFYSDLDDQFDFELPYVSDVDGRFIIGSFYSGDAYGSNSDDEIYKIYAELKFKF